MRLLITPKILVAFCVAFWSAIPAQGSIVVWTDWKSATTSPGTVSGSMGNVGVTYTGNYSFVELGTGTNYWTEPNSASKPYTGNAVVSNAPTASEMIALSAAATHTITFSQPVTNLVMAIVSLGQPSLPVAYDFDTPFTVLSEGKGYWGDGSYTTDDTKYILYGKELHCVIQFTGAVSSITWTSSPGEYWHGVTVGTVVPEPATLIIWSLLGFGSWLGLRISRRRESVGRPAWSDENRQAIQDIVARGMPR